MRYKTRRYTKKINKNKIEALHTTRKTMIEDYGKKHHYYWAAFVLIGDYR